MAPRRNENSRYKSGRERSDRTFQSGAGLFDLREDQEVPGEERPYRERHRVEVSSGWTGQESLYSSGNKRPAGQSGQDRHSGQESLYSSGNRRPAGQSGQDRHSGQESLYSSGNRRPAGQSGQDRHSGQGSLYSSGNQIPADQSGGRQIETDLLSYNGNRSRGSRSSGGNTFSGRNSASGRVVRGNMPGRRNAADQTQPGRQSYGQNGSYGQNNNYGQRSSYGQNSTYGQRSSYGQNSTYGQSGSYGQKASGTRRQNTAYGQCGSYGQNSTYGQRSSRVQPGTGTRGQGSAYGQTASGTRRENRSSGQNRSYAPNQAGRNLEEYRRRIRQIDVDIDSYDRGYDAFSPAELDLDEIRREEETYRTGDTGRESRRRAVRREREKQVRRMYIRLGAAGAVLLLLLILIPVAVHRLSGKKGTPDAGDTTLAQQQAAPAQGTDTGSEDVTPEQGADAQSGSGSADREADAQSADDVPDKGTDARSEETASDQESDPQSEDAAPEQETGTQSEDAAPDQETGTKSEDAASEQDADARSEEAASEQETGTQSEDTAPEQGADGQEQGTEASGTLQEGGPAGRNQNYARQDEWNLIVVNPWTELPGDYTFETTSLSNGESVDSRCFGALTQMLDACRNAGNTPVVCSSYRSHEKQIGLFENQVKTEMAKGLNRAEAEVEAATTVATPGTSEHELGLAVDICDYDYQALDENQANTETQQWMMKHCWEYGFILRYPVDKGDITGIIYEPWHYRYVGLEAAREMYNGGNGWICLEEYLAQ